MAKKAKQKLTLQSRSAAKIKCQEVYKGSKTTRQGQCPCGSGMKFKSCHEKIFMSEIKSPPKSTPTRVKKNDSPTSKTAKTSEGRI